MNFIPNSLEQLYQCPLSSADLTQLSQKGIDMIAQLYIQRPVNINLQITYTDYFFDSNMCYVVHAI